jgi:DNA-binding HxlR family transcriptional regulator
MTWRLPAQDTEYALALRLLGQPARTQLEVLEALMAEPKTFGELRPLLKGRNNNVLTKALRALREQGLIQQGLRQDLRTKAYRLTSLGKLVILRSHEMLPHKESIEAYRRGERASA